MCVYLWLTIASSQSVHEQVANAEFAFCVGTRGQSLKEDWIAYICREILRVRASTSFYFKLHQFV